MGKIVPIRFVDQQGNPSESMPGQPFNAIPVMDVIFRFEPTPIWEPRYAHETSILALVDTGADSNLCDKALIAAVQSPQTATVTFTGSTSMIKTSRHVGHLVFPTIKTRIQTDVEATALRDLGFCYDMVIGRLTLQLGKLVMDYPGQRFFWEIPGQ